MSEPHDIESVKVVTILAPLPVPVRFGAWVMRHREFALCAVRSHSGTTGYGVCYTRDGPIGEIVRRLIAPSYVGHPAQPAERFAAAARSNNAILSDGVGHRALSIVDIATWDLAAKLDGLPIEEFLGGTRMPSPVTAIVGYPPTMSAEEVGQQVEGLWRAGWRRFKQPIAGTPEETLQRLRAAREAAPTAWLGIDLNWVCGSVAEVVDLVKPWRGLNLGWIEDVMPPGHPDLLASIRREAGIPLAMGDEQGGSYFPDALLAAKAVDVQRVDVSTNGGVTRLKSVIEKAQRAGVPFAPHMHPTIHSRLMSAWGFSDIPIEWAIPGTGVDQIVDSIVAPTVREGYMEPLDAAPGFGPTVSKAWLEEQIVDDPDNLLEDL